MPPLTLSPYDRLQSAAIAPLLLLPDRAKLALAGGTPLVVDGQTLDPTLQLIFALRKLQPQPPLDTLAVPQARAQLRREVAMFAGLPIAVARVDSVEVAGAAGPLQARRYVPHGFTAPGPGLVYFHGGGWTLCDLDTHDQTCRLLAQRSGATVIAVDYRLAPEHPFPAPVDDAVAAFADVHERAAEHGIDPKRLAVGGDSAGGHLANAVSYVTTRAGDDAPEFQLLIYPGTDFTRERPSHELFGEGYLLTARDTRWYAGHFLPPGSDRTNPVISPLLADDLAGMPPTYLTTAGFDPLRDEGIEYAERLRDAGVAVTLRHHPSLIHGFANMVARHVPSRLALTEAAGTLQIGLRTKPRKRRRSAK